MAAKITVTEALAEIKTIGKRIEKKREAILQYCARQEIVRDPLEKDGGSVSFIERELQAINDLGTRQVAIRREIARVNSETMLTIGKSIRSIADWLVWRREVATGQKDCLSRIAQRIRMHRDEAMKKGFNVVEAGKASNLSDLIVNVNERKLAEDIEDMENVLGILDGQLSLKNATVFIEL